MERKIAPAKFVVDIVTSLFILLFVYAAVSKLVEFEKFTIQLGKSPLLAPFANWVSWGIPFFEIGIALLLTIDRFQLAALYASFSLMVVFSAYIITILNFSEYVPCSCGGILENMNWYQHLFFNISYVLLAVTGILLYKKK